MGAGSEAKQRRRGREVCERVCVSERAGVSKHVIQSVHMALYYAVINT